MEFCEYNLFTLTGRPSNHFNNINYAALNKEDGSRKRFTSRFDKGFLMEIDLSGFHLYLIYTILGLKFPENIYNELSKYYPKNENPKEYTFKQIYGGIDKELQEIDPFKSINNLIRQTFISYKTGNLKTFLFDKPMILESNLSQTKVFNYMLQNLETEFNANLLESINKFLRERNSKLILYTYDSFLIDFSMEDGNKVLKELIGLFGDIPFKIKVGTNYHELKNIRVCWAQLLEM
mgnify:CR=1 FL=1